MRVFRAGIAEPYKETHDAASRARLFLLVATAGGRHPDYREADGQRVMKQSEIRIRVALARGDHATTVWTCDLSHDYVSINADYRS